MKYPSLLRRLLDGLSDHHPHRAKLTAAEEDIKQVMLVCQGGREEGGSLVGSQLESVGSQLSWRYLLTYLLYRDSTAILSVAILTLVMIRTTDQRRGQRTVLALREGSIDAAGALETL